MEDRVLEFRRCSLSHKLYCIPGIEFSTIVIALTVGKSSSIRKHLWRICINNSTMLGIAIVQMCLHKILFYTYIDRICNEIFTCLYYVYQLVLK